MRRGTAPLEEAESTTDDGWAEADGQVGVRGMWLMAASANDGHGE